MQLNIFDVEYAKSIKGNECIINSVDKRIKVMLMQYSTNFDGSSTIVEAAASTVFKNLYQNLSLHGDRNGI